MGASFILAHYQVIGPGGVRRFSFEPGSVFERRAAHNLLADQLRASLTQSGDNAGDQLADTECGRLDTMPSLRPVRPFHGGRNAG